MACVGKEKNKGKIFVLGYTCETASISSLQVGEQRTGACVYIYKCDDWRFPLR
jgi:hypothetical protein